MEISSKLGQVEEGEEEPSTEQDQLKVYVENEAEWRLKESGSKEEAAERVRGERGSTAPTRPVIVATTWEGDIITGTV